MVRYLLVFANLLILLPGCSQERFDPGVASYIDSLMNADIKPDGPGAVILVAMDGVPIFRKAYGLANLELNVPVKPENVFAIASMTKQFTAICILQLVQQGKLSLLDDIRKYLPEYNTHGRLITIEHLLTHTNGIPNITYRGEFYGKEIVEPSREELLGCVANDSLLFEPGSDWSYNDFGYILAAFIVERVSGVPFHDYMHKNIFDALGMKNSTFGSRERVIPLLVTAYTAAEGNSLRPEEYYNWTWNFGMGDILTTVDDMLRWDEGLYTERLVRHELLEKAWTPYVLANGQSANYGYGWWVAKYQGLQIIAHSGAIGGFRSISVRIPSQHLFVVILSNNAGFDFSKCVGAIALRVAGRTVTLPPTHTLSLEEMRGYTGVYEMPHFGILSTRDITPGKVYRNITLQDTVLMSQTPDGSKRPLLNVGNDLFALKGSTSYLRFRRGDTGSITALESYSEPVTYGPVQTELKTNRLLPQERISISLDEKFLKGFAGKYNFGGEHTARVRVEGSHIFMQGVGEIIPEGMIRFFVKDADVTVEFLKNPKGAVTGVILNRVRKYEGRKIE